MKWPFVSRKKYDLIVQVKNEYAKECVELRREWAQEFHNYMQNTNMQAMKFLEFRRHVAKTAPQALKKRNAKGQFTGDTW